MRTKLKYTRGELAAAVLMLVVILSGNIFYFFYEDTRKPDFEMERYAALFEDFVVAQKRIDDSLTQVRRDRKSYMGADTVPKSSKAVRSPMYEIVKIELNSCDTNDLLTVPQFGPKRAVKLVEYRERLGGFHCFTQLHEVFVLQNIDTARLKEYLFIGKGGVRKINLNSATYKELVAHPYLDSYLTKLIVRHRETKGPIRNLDELREITHAYPELIDRLRPYVCF